MESGWAALTFPISYTYNVFYCGYVCGVTGQGWSWDLDYMNFPITDWTSIGGCNITTGTMQRGLCALLQGFVLTIGY